MALKWLETPQYILLFIHINLYIFVEVASDADFFAAIENRTKKSSKEIKCGIIRVVYVSVYLDVCVY